MSESGLEDFPDTPESTGVEAVDQALTALDGLPARPVDEHAAVFEAVHDALRAVLSGDARA